MTELHSRRAFLGVVGAAAAAVAAAPKLARARPTLPSEALRRARRALDVRIEAARAQLDGPPVDHPTNGDEQRYASRIGNYSKGLPHDRRGEVAPSAYASLLRAIGSGNPEDFARIRMGGVRPLTNPLSGLAFEFQGADSHSLAMAPPPAFASAEQAGELVELYWMALLRDVPFAVYDRDPAVHAAAAELSKLSDYHAPKERGRVVPGTIFRSSLPGVLDGPFVSQFLWKDAVLGAEVISRRIKTAKPGLDYMTSFEDWLAAQSGASFPAPRYDRTRRYIRNGRDLATWVYMDVPYQAWLNALAILFRLGAPVDQANPYNDVAVYRGRIAGRYWRNQSGWGTFGHPYMSTVVAAVSRAAMTAAWFQKWYVHRRVRPEALGGRVHLNATRRASYPLHAELTGSNVVDRVFSGTGTYLLPQAYPEGCPTHPSYAAGHATVAGACTTVLKAFFDESFVLPNQVEASASGQGLGEYLGPYVRSTLTVGGELNKLAFNVAVGRNFAGIHWRSDMTESMKLGEEVALRFLRDERSGYREHFDGFSLTRFDGRKVAV